MKIQDPIKISSPKKWQFLKPTTLAPCCQRFKYCILRVFLILFIMLYQIQVILLLLSFQPLSAILITINLVCMVCFLCSIYQFYRNNNDNSFINHDSQIIASEIFGRIFKKSKNKAEIAKQTSKKDLIKQKCTICQKYTKHTYFHCYIVQYCIQQHNFNAYRIVVLFFSMVLLSLLTSNMIVLIQKYEELNLYQYLSALIISILISVQFIVIVFYLVYKFQQYSKKTIQQKLGSQNHIKNACFPNYIINQEIVPQNTIQIKFQRSRDQFNSEMLNIQKNFVIRKKRKLISEIPMQTINIVSTQQSLINTKREISTSDFNNQELKSCVLLKSSQKKIKAKRQSAPLHSRFRLKKRVKHQNNIVNEQE